MEIEVYKIDGTKSDQKVTLPEEIFGIEPHQHLMYQAVRIYLANQRQGTHKTKGRSEVRGGGRKPWRQKGTGRARVGTIRSPLWIGGGSIHGPQPRSYRMKITKKMHALARRSALSMKLKSGELRIVEDFSFEEPKTKKMINILTALGLENTKTLLLVPQKEENIMKSGRNIPGLSVIEAGGSSTYQILNNKMLLVQLSALDSLTKPLMATKVSKS